LFPEGCQSLAAAKLNMSLRCILQAAGGEVRGILKRAIKLR